MSISLLSEAFDIEEYAVRVVEVRVRVWIVDSAISRFGRGAPRVSSDGESENDRTLWQSVSAQRS